MNAISYDTIAQNVGDVRVQGSTVFVTWNCASTGRKVGESSANMIEDTSVGGRAQSNIKRNIISEIMSGLARLISGLLGGAAGRVVSSAAYTASSDLQYKANSAMQYGEGSRRAAIVAAFAQVQSQFVWNDKQQRFTAR